MFWFGFAAAFGATACLAATVAVAQVKVPEGTEFSVRVEDTITSLSAHEGDRFTVSLEDDVNCRTARFCAPAIAASGK